MLVGKPRYSRTKNVIAGIFCCLVGGLFIWMTFSDFNEYGNCLWAGILALAFGIFSIVYTPKSKANKPIH